MCNFTNQTNGRFIIIQLTFIIKILINPALFIFILKLIKYMFLIINIFYYLSFTKFDVNHQTIKVGLRQIL